MFRLFSWLASVMAALSPASVASAKAPEQRHIAAQFLAEIDEPAAVWWLGGGQGSGPVRMPPAAARSPRSLP